MSAFNGGGIPIGVVTEATFNSIMTHSKYACSLGLATLSVLNVFVEAPTVFIWSERD